MGRILGTGQRIDREWDGLMETGGCFWLEKNVDVGIGFANMTRQDGLASGAF